MSPSPRLIALGVVLKGNQLLVSECYDPVTGAPFFRPPGGSIEFGERGAETVAREFLEEVGVVVTGVRYLGTLENLFTYAGEPGHEVVLVYEASFADPSLYARESFPRLDRPRAPRRVVWRSWTLFQENSVPLYPTGLLDLLLTRLNVVE